MSVMETVYNDRNNKIDLLLKDDSSGTLAAADLSSVTRTQLVVGATTLDSDNVGEDGYFDLTDGADGKLYLILGEAGLDAGYHTAKLVLFDATNTLGIMWGELRLAVYA